MMKGVRLGFFGRFLYSQFFFRLELRKHSMILKAIPKSNIVLDGGCSFGVHSEGFEKRASCLIGLDVVKKALVGYRRRFGNHALVILASLDYLPFRANSLDGCVLQDSLEHTKDPINVLIQIESAMKPNGTVVVTVPNWYNRFLNLNISNVETHQQFRSSLGWRRILKKASFHDCDVSSITFPVLDIQILRKYFHLLGACVMLRARKEPRQRIR